MNGYLQIVKFFKGLSMSQIVAGSLAAVTSFLLSAKIGIAGSVIGAAASYVISTVASNLYKNVLEASGEKLQSVTGGGDAKPDDDASNTSDGASEGPSDESSEVSNDSASADESGKSSPADGTQALDAVGDGERTTVLSGVGAAVPRTARSGSAGRDASGVYTVEGLRRSRARRISPKRMAIIVSLVSGLLGVAVTAGVVMLFTQGQGTDTVVRDIVSPSTSQRVEPGTTDDDPYAGYGPQAPSDTEDGADASTGTGKTDKSDKTDGSSTSGSTGSGSSSSGSTGSGSGSSSSDSSGSTDTGSGSPSSGSTGSTDTGSGSAGSGSSSSGSTGSGSGSSSTDGSGL